MAAPPRRILILDGGLGTSLEQQHGVVFGRATPLWSSHLLVADPHTLLRCQASFGRVPVDVVLTATYQASAEGFAATRTPAFPDGVDAARVPRFLDDAVRIAQLAACPGDDDDAARIALSLGPYGACVVPSCEYSGRYDAAHDSRAALRDWHCDRMRLFAGAVADLDARVAFVALETIPRVDEVEAMRQALAAVPRLAALPFWMSCLFPDGDALPGGASPEAAVRAMLHPAVAPGAVPWGVGINCTRVSSLDALLHRYEAAIDAMVREGFVGDWPALVLYPDGTNGELYNTTTQAWERRPDDAAGACSSVSWERRLAEVVQAAEARGKWPQILVGGCCRTGPDDIARLRRLLLPT